MIRRFLKLALVTAFFSACSSTPKDVSNVSRGDAPAPKTKASMEAKQLAAEQEYQYVTELTFRPGSAELTSISKTKLQKLLRSIQNEDEVEKIEVISWADQAYPTKEVRRLSKEQQKLADARNQTIQSFLKTQNKNYPINLHNMAVRTNAIGNMWGGSDARIKKSLESSGLTKVGSKAKTSQAMVMVEID